MLFFILAKEIHGIDGLTASFWLRLNFVYLLFFFFHFPFTLFLWFFFWMSIFRIFVAFIILYSQTNFTIERANMTTKIMVLYIDIPVTKNGRESFHDGLHGNVLIPFNAIQFLSVSFVCSMSNTIRFTVILDFILINFMIFHS